MKRWNSSFSINDCSDATSATFGAVLLRRVRAIAVETGFRSLLDEGRAGEDVDDFIRKRVVEPVGPDETSVLLHRLARLLGQRGIIRAERTARPGGDVDHRVRQTDQLAGEIGFRLVEVSFRLLGGFAMAEAVIGARQLRIDHQIEMLGEFVEPFVTLQPIAQRRRQRRVDASGQSGHTLLDSLKSGHRSSQPNCLKHSGLVA